MFDGIPATSGQPYGLLDLTYRDIYNLWVERHRQLIEDGLDAPACDAQIAIPDGVNARNGERPARRCAACIPCWCGAHCSTPWPA